MYAFVLIQGEVGKTRTMSDGLRGIVGVQKVECVTGSYDVIALVEAPSVDDIGRLVAGAIQGVEGVTRTVTCPIVHL